MAEDEGGSSRPPSKQPVEEVKTEPLSPGRERELSESYPFPMRFVYQNGMTNGDINGEYANSEDSTDCGNTDDADAPLDFSMKKSQTGNKSAPIEENDDSREHSNNVGSSLPPYRTEYSDQLYQEVNGKSAKDDKNGSQVGGNTGPTRKLAEVKTEKIGEPQTALPGMLPGTTVPHFHGEAGLIPGMLPSGLPFPNPALLGAFPLLGAAGLPDNHFPSGRGKGGKPTRPFKAYPKEPLSLPIGYYGLPGMAGLSMHEGVDPSAYSAGSEELFKAYLQQVQEQMRVQRGNGLTKAAVRQTSPRSTDSLSPLSNPPTLSPPASLSQMIPATSPQSQAVTTSTPGPSTPGRKRPRSLPDDQKDSSYWERRRKNNEAAKRSRDSRRAKEDEIAIRAAFLEQENLKLRVEVAALKNETAKLRCMLYNS